MQYAPSLRHYQPLICKSTNRCHKSEYFLSPLRQQDLMKAPSHFGSCTVRLTGTMKLEPSSNDEILPSSTFRARICSTKAARYLAAACFLSQRASFSGVLASAAPSDFDYDAAAADIDHVFVGGKLTAPQVASWREFLDRRPRTHADMKGAMSRFDGAREHPSRTISNHRSVA